VPSKVARHWPSLVAAAAPGRTQSGGRGLWESGASGSREASDMSGGTQWLACLLQGVVTAAGDAVRIPMGQRAARKLPISRFWVFLANEQLDVKVTFIFFEI